MKSAIGMVVIAALLFAFNGVASKAVLVAGLDPLRLAELRSTATFLAIAVVTSVREHRHPQAKAIPLLVAFGISEFFVVPVAYFVAIRSLPLGVALLIEYLAPVFATIWLTLKHKAVSGSATWAGLALSLTGLALVGEVWTKLRFNPVGIAFAFAAAIALAFSFVAGEIASVRQGSLNTMLWGSGAGAITAAVVRPWWSFRPSMLSANTHGFPVWVVCVDIVTLGTILPYLLLVEGLKRISATRVGLLMTLEPASAVWLAWALLDERLGPIQVAGGAVVLSGVIMAEVARGAPGNVGDRPHLSA